MIFVWIFGTVVVLFIFGMLLYIAVMSTRVHHEITTINNSSLAQLGDAMETRRIQAIPKENRTLSEQIHVHEIDDEGHKK